MSWKNTEFLEVFFILLRIYSIDFRCKVLSVREKKDLTIVQVAKRFCVGIASVMSWIKDIESKLTRKNPALDGLLCGYHLNSRKT